ncbi:hypothetical protein ACWEQG_07505 [Microbispora sp. NPDC004025]
MEPAVGGPIGERWGRTGGVDGPLGRPAAAESDTDSGSRRQTFEHCEIVWSVPQEMVTTVYRIRDIIAFEWSVLPTSDFNYEYWQYELTYSRAGAPPERTSSVISFTDERKGGRIKVRSQGFGEYGFTVRGCDDPGADQCRQGWTAPVRVSVGVEPGEEPPFPVEGLIGERWHELGGAAGPLGRPARAAVAGSDPGQLIQEFQYGQAAVDTRLGPQMAMVAYQQGGTIVLDWGQAKDPGSGLTYTVFRVDVFYEGTKISEHLVTEDDPLPPGNAPHFRSGCGHLRYSPAKGDGWYMFWVYPGVAGAAVGFGDPMLPGTSVRFTAPAFGFPLPVDALGGTPAGAVASEHARARALGEYLVRHRTLPLGELIEQNEDLGSTMVAHLQAVHRQADFRNPGEPPSRLLVNETLLDLWPSPVGTSTDADETFAALFRCRRLPGEYDTLLKHLVVIAYRYADLLQPRVYDHLVDRLLSVRGPHDTSAETKQIDCDWSHPVLATLPDPFAVAVTIFTSTTDIVLPETENHQLLIESARFLANQLLFERTGDPRYNSLDNGLTDWLLKFMHTIACHDFLEFNARPYQRYSLNALLNLYDFAKDHSIRTAAQILLDYATVKFAVSSSALRRIGPYRRLPRNINRPPFPDTRPDGTPFTNTSNNELYSAANDPLTGLFFLWAGQPRVHPNEPTVWYPDHWSQEGQLAALTDYRPPPAAYVLALGGWSGQHRFYHGRRPSLPGTEGSEQAAGGVEIYYRTPSFLLSAGGIFLNSGYGHDERTNYAQVAVPQATTLLPTRAPALNFDELIRFEQWPNDDRSANNLGVHKGFACGANLRLPSRWTTGAIVDGNWTFLHLSTAEDGDLNVYVAAFTARLQAHPDEIYDLPENVGLIYAMEPTKGMTLESFATATSTGNHLPDTWGYLQQYIFRSPDNHTFTFVVAPRNSLWAFGAPYRPRVTKMDDDDLDHDFSGLPLAEGPFLKAQHDGRIKITYPSCDIPLELDFHNPVYPFRRDNQAACPQWAIDVIQAFRDRAKALFDAGRREEALTTVEAAVAYFQRALKVNPDLRDEPLRKIAEEWLATARAAHPHDVPVQLAAARNSWEVARYLAVRPGTGEANHPLLAQHLHALAGFLAFGSPTTDLATQAAALARQLFANLRDGDHRLDIAASWSAEALFHHEVSFNSGNPDPKREQELQRAAAAEAMAILDPIVQSLPGSRPSSADLTRTADMLRQLIGLLTFGAPDSTPSVRAAELARRVYTAMTDGDHRVDVAAIWTALSLRHHETSFHPDNADPDQERVLQRRAAGEAARILIPIAEALPDPDLPADELLRIADMLDRLTGLLTFGAPAPPTAEDAELLRLADHAAALRDEIHSQIGT